MRAVVVFLDCKWSWIWWFTKPGFRHCELLLVDDGGLCTVMSYVWGSPVIAGIDNPPETLDVIERRGGVTLIEVEVPAVRRRCWWMAGTCVGFLKMVLGIRDPFIITPHQLYRRLKRSTP